MTQTTVLLKLSGLTQRWGLWGAFERRDTAMAPTKSGVIGLVGAAIGRDREASYADLNQLTLAVRIDDPGEEFQDLHTVSGLRSASGKFLTESKLTKRAYLTDAVFTAALSGEDITLIQQIAHGLQHPVWPLFLGARSCIPSCPIYLGLTEGDAYTVICGVPYQGRRSRPPARMLVNVDDPDGPNLSPDQPVSYGRGTRAHQSRATRTERITTPIYETDTDSRLLEEEVT